MVCFVENNVETIAGIFLLEARAAIIITIETVVENRILETCFRTLENWFEGYIILLVLFGDPCENVHPLFMEKFAYIEGLHVLAKLYPRNPPRAI